MTEAQNSDRVLVAVSKDGLLRARAARTSGVVADALSRHVPGRLASLALARALTSAALFPISEKDAERVGMQWSGEGVLGTIMAEVRPPGRLRALVTVPQAEPVEGKYPGRRGIGFALQPNGFLSILKQSKEGTFTQGQVQLYSGEIDEDLEYYFQKSEQTPTRIRVMADLSSEDFSVKSGGVMVQCLGGAEEEMLPDFRLHERLAPEHSPQEMLETVFGERAYEVVNEHELEYACPCTRERIEAGIMLVGAEELLDMINVDQGAKVHCDFCGTNYVFDRTDLEDMLARKLTDKGDG